MGVVAGVDGCKDGWVCIAETEDGRLSPFVAPTFADLLVRLPDTAIIAIDVPIGLTDSGPRLCDTAARRLLGAPRASSVFPAPVRRALGGGSYEEVCRALSEAGQPKLSKQAWSIVPKIREVDAVLSAHPALQALVREIHPEVCFAVWNGGRAMQYPKATPPAAPGVRLSSTSCGRKVR